MKKHYILGILFFGGLWGASEGLLGNSLYNSGARFPSVYLTVIALVILTMARRFFPQAGTATLIGLSAMLYKFLNVPFFGCHLFAIAIVGVGYDLFFNVLKIRNRSLGAVGSVYFSYIAFSFALTYVIRYSYWVEGGLDKIIQYIAVSGTMAAVGSAILVPLTARLVEKAHGMDKSPIEFQGKLVPAGVSLVTAGLWAFTVAGFFIG